VTPVLERLAGETDRVEFVKIDIDDNPVVASKYDVLSLPTVMLFENGSPKETLVGARPAGHFRKAFANYL
jgi:thioredoxin 1